MLAKSYRFTAYNACGQTIAAAGIVVKARRWKLDSTGALVYEASEASLMSNGSTVANGAYASSSSIDNSTDKYIGGDFTATIVAPTSSVGYVAIYCEASTDGGTTFPTNGRGTLVRTILTAAAGTYTEVFKL